VTRGVQDGRPPRTVPKFLRHLAAVTLVVGAVVVLGIVWNHFDASSLAGGAGGRFSKEIAVSSHPPRTVVLRKAGGGHSGPIVIRNDGGMNLGLSSMFDAVNRPVVEHTIAIEVAVIAAVVLIDASRRRARKARRARLLSQFQADSGGTAIRQPAGSAASQAQQEPGQAP
jgi:hypothetical protein